jgi:hypothetical protein
MRAYSRTTFVLKVEAEYSSETLIRTQRLQGAFAERPASP